MGFMPVAALLRKHAQAFPHKLALQEAEGGQSLDFAGLHDAVTHAASRLQALGMQSGDKVILAGESSVAKLVAWLAIWQSGGVVCPLDPAFVRHGAEEIMATIDPQWVLQDETASVQQMLFADEGEFVPVLRYAQKLCAARLVLESGMVPCPVVDELRLQMPSVNAEDLACIVCTSGTTGQPKMVLYDHQALWLNGLDSIHLLSLTAQDVLLEYRSLNWYSSQILSLMPFLQLGLTLVMAPRFSLSQFPQWVRDCGLTVSVGVPTVIQLLLKQADAGQIPDLGALRLMTSSTAPLAAHHWQRFEAVYGIPVLNLYGSTETGWISGNRLSCRKLGSVGKLLPSVTLADQHALAGGQVQKGPHTAVGRLSVQTPKMALGYLSPAGRFHPLRGKPFALQDIVHLDGEDFVHVLGRADDLIIRAGIKISPVEIEAVILDHPAVEDVGIVGVPDELLGMRMACFVVLAADADLEAVQAYCQQQLPREKVPAQWFPVLKLPRNARGKLMRQHLVMLVRDQHV